MRGRTTELKILESTAKVIRSHGPLNVPVAQIILHAHIAESTFYYYFHDTTDILNKQVLEIHKAITSLPHHDKPHSTSNISSDAQNLIIELYKTKISLDIILLTEPTKLIKPLIIYIAHYFPDHHIPNYPILNHPVINNEFLIFCAWQIIGQLHLWQKQEFSKRYLNHYTNRVAQTIKFAQRNYNSIIFYDEKLIAPAL